MPQASEHPATPLDLPVELSEGQCFLIRGKAVETSYRLFQRLVEHGYAGLCVSRIFPDRVRERFGLTTSRIWWISHSPGDEHVDPTAIGTLASVIEGFIGKQPGRSVVLLDGLEFLAISVGFVKALFFLEHLCEYIMPRDAIVLIPVDPACFDTTEFARLERFREGLDEPEVRRLLDGYDVSQDLLGQ